VRPCALSLFVHYSRRDTISPLNGDRLMVVDLNGTYRTQGVVGVLHLVAEAGGAAG